MAIDYEYENPFDIFRPRGIAGFEYPYTPGFNPTVPHPLDPRRRRGVIGQGAAATPEELAGELAEEPTGIPGLAVQPGGTQPRMGPTAEEVSQYSPEYQEARTRFGELMKQPPQFEEPKPLKWWQKLIATGLGGLAGWGRQEVPDVQAEREARAQRKFERKKSAYGQELGILRDVMGMERQEREAASERKERAARIEYYGAQAQAARRRPEDKYIRAYTNEQGQTVEVYQKPDGTRYEVTGQKIQGKTDTTVTLDEALMSTDPAVRARAERAVRLKGEVGREGKGELTTKDVARGKTTAEQSYDADLADAENRARMRVDRIKQRYLGGRFGQAEMEQLAKEQPGVAAQMQAEIEQVYDDLANDKTRAERTYRGALTNLGQEPGQPANYLGERQWQIETRGAPAEPRVAGPSAGAGKVLTPEIANAYYDRAGGNREKARAMARADGYIVQ